MDCSLPGNSVHGILQARILEWVAISSSRGSSWPRDGTWGSCVTGRFLNGWAVMVDWQGLKIHLKAKFDLFHRNDSVCVCVCVRERERDRDRDRDWEMDLIFSGTWLKPPARSGMAPSSSLRGNIPEIVSAGPWGQNYSYNNPWLLFSIICWHLHWQKQW